MNRVSRVRGMLEEVAFASGSTGKMAVLKKYRNDEEFVFILEFLLNPYKITGLGTASIKNSNVSATTNADLFDVIDNLVEYPSNSSSTIDYVRTFINSHSEHCDFLERLFTKNIKLGVTSKTANKVFGKGYFPDYQVMKGEKYDEKMMGHTLYSQGIIISPKLDGHRCTLVVENGVAKFFASSGTIITGLVELEKEALELTEGVYDGELLATEMFSNHNERFKATGSLVKTAGNKTGLSFYVFDFIETHDFGRGISYTPYIRRIEDAKMIIDPLELPHIQTVDTLACNYNIEGYTPAEMKQNNIELVNKYFKEALESNEEGIMVHSCLGSYEQKRTKSLLKVKALFTADLRIVGFEEGTNKYEGKLGALVVEYAPNGIYNTVNVAPGLTDEMREVIWNNKDQYLGKIIEVAYMTETTDSATGKNSILLPRIKCFRDDKSEPSYN